MKVYHHLQQFEKLENAVVTTGTFDGVHYGHRKILARLNEVAVKNGGESVLLTFHPHPRMVLQPDLDIKLITTLEEKIALLAETGLQHLIIHPFTREFSRTPSEEFIRNILVEQIGARKLVIGYDHHFGKNREGSFEHLKAYGPTYGFDVEEIPEQDIEEVAVSSTKIRKALEDGDVATASTFLGRPFSLSGKVVTGAQIGRQIGFPTANIQCANAEKILPADGVYAVRCRINGEPTHRKGMANLGIRPTVNGADRKLEVYLFDFKGNLYENQIEVSFLKRIREERQFTDLDSLVVQIHIDEEAVKKYFAQI